MTSGIVTQNPLTASEKLRATPPVGNWVIGLLLSIFLSIFLVAAGFAIGLATSLGLLSPSGPLHSFTGPLILCGLLTLMLAAHCGDKNDSK
jgi:hypothetical protein